MDKVKREEEAYQSRNMGAPQPLPALAAASPTYPYPSGPPPPYSQPPQHANIWLGAQSTRTPPMSRRPSVGEQENIKQTVNTVRQSLPSLSEALGVDSHNSYPARPPLPPVSHAPSVAPSPPPSTVRSFGVEAPHATHPTAPALPPHPSYRPEPPTSPQDSARPSYTSPSDRPPLRLQTAHPPARQQQASYPPHPSDISPAYEQPPTQAPNAMGPPGFPYGYAPYPPRYAQPATSSTTVGPIYQPSVAYPAPQTPSSTWKSENATSRVGSDDRPAAPADYSTSVKRHLDLYDLEGSLNEVSLTAEIRQDESPHRIPPVTWLVKDLRLGDLAFRHLPTQCKSTSCTC